MGSIQELPPSKWHLDINHFADILDITVAETNGFIKCIEKGGIGLKTNESWRTNPAPYNKPINLSSINDNSLNLNVSSKGRKVVSGEDDVITVPSVVILDKKTQFVRLGKKSVHKTTTSLPRYKERL